MFGTETCSADSSTSTSSRREQGRIDPRYADEWERVLRQPVPEIRRTIVEESQTGDDLRQSSPFAGMLSEPERQQILRGT